MQDVTSRATAPAETEGVRDAETTLARTAQPGDAQGERCDPQVHLTRSLLGYRGDRGADHTVVSLAQALTRQGFDIGRHQWSLLENGDLGWIQIANFLLSGAMLVAFAVGLRRRLAPGVGSRWAPRLTAVFGVCLMAAGVFTADPALGFPAGTPEGPGQISWHGLLHFSAAGVGFTAIAATCFVIARRYTADGQRPPPGTPAPPGRSSWPVSCAWPPARAAPWRTCCSSARSSPCGPGSPSWR
jgi:hypothetical protein